MNIVRNENIDPYDVDGTLILHEDPDLIPKEDQVRVYDSVSCLEVIVRIHRPMVRLLKESRSRGSYVIVWSRGGYEWASNVIQALGLTDYVDLVISKPMAYFDDTPIEKWLPYRVFIDPNTIYKDNNQTKE